jgi:hypothetical protein
MNHKFSIHVLLKARLQRGLFCIAFNGTSSFQPYRCTMQTEIPIKINGSHLRRLTVLIWLYVTFCRNKTPSELTANQRDCSNKHSSVKGTVCNDASPGVARRSCGAIVVVDKRPRMSVALQLSGRSSTVTHALLGRATVCSNKKTLLAQGLYAVDWPARDCTTGSI